MNRFKNSDAEAMVIGCYEKQAITSSCALVKESGECFVDALQDGGVTGERSIFNLAQRPSGQTDNLQIGVLYR